MNSWLELGEGIGHRGDKLDVWRLTCPFCDEKGNFTLAYHAEKKKPNPDKRLNFDLYQCRNCMGFVHVLWSAGELASLRGGLYDYQVLPWPLNSKPEPSDNWPVGMRRFWVQAHDSLANENWDAANVMARSALQFVVREKGAVEGKLFVQINDLATKGILDPLMKDWAHDGHLRHQSAPTFDMSLNKTTSFTERVRLQFRAEAFNLFNKFRYARQDFDNNTGNASFGTIVKLSIGDGSNVGSPRQIQLALKLIF